MRRSWRCYADMRMFKNVPERIRRLKIPMKINEILSLRVLKSSNEKLLSKQSLDVKTENSCITATLDNIIAFQLMEIWPILGSSTSISLVISVWIVHFTPFRWQASQSLSAKFVIYPNINSFCEILKGEIWSSKNSLMDCLRLVQNSLISIFMFD